MLYSIHGRIPSKKNQKSIFYRNGKPFISTSQKFKEWHKYAVEEISLQKPKMHPGPVRIHVDFYLPDNRKTDLSNKLESINDLLVDVGIIEDDCWQQVPEIVSTGQLDKENPRAIIQIIEIKD